MGLRHTGCTLVSGSLLALCLLGNPASAGSASAHISVCRNDPILTLSNGMTLHMEVTIEDSVPDITAIGYTVHLPVGVAVRHISYPSNTFSRVESVQAIADGPANTYVMSTSVATHASRAAFTANDALTWANSPRSSGSGSGLSQVEAGGATATPVVVKFDS